MKHVRVTKEELLDATTKKWVKEFGTLSNGSFSSGYFFIGFLQGVLADIDVLMVPKPKGEK